MSILDFAENPEYSMIAVAISKTDCAIVLNVKKENAKGYLETAIMLLQNELETLNRSVIVPPLPPVTQDK